jgi:hypothetical protein
MATKYTKWPQNMYTIWPQNMYTKWPQNIPNIQKVQQSISSIASPSKIYPNYDFWFETMPSGNPGFNSAKPNFFLKAALWSSSLAILHSTFILYTLFVFSSIWTGLPDGIFSNRKSQFGKILEGLATDDVGIFCGHWVNFPSIRYILWQFGIY